MGLDEPMVAVGVGAFIVILFGVLLAALLPGALWEKRVLEKFIQALLINSDCSLEKAIDNISVCNSIFDEENIDECLQQKGI